MEKIVCYNGKTKSFFDCTEPKELIRGRIYEVVNIVDYGFRYKYVLRGIKGSFDSNWFDEPKTFIATSYNIPKVGVSYECLILDFSKGEINLKPYRTSVVQSFSNVGNLYKVVTSHSVYIVQVAK